MERLAPGDGEADRCENDARLVSERGTLSLPDAAWTDAQRRAAVIGPLAAQAAVSTAAARDAGQTLGFSKRTVYALLRRWRQSGGLAASLVPRPSPGGWGKGRLPGAAERIVAEAIRDEYLTKQKKRAKAVVRAVRDRCRLDGTKPRGAQQRRKGADMPLRRGVPVEHGPLLVHRRSVGRSHSGAVPGGPQRVRAARRAGCLLRPADIHSSARSSTACASSTAARKVRSLTLCIPLGPKMDAVVLGP